MRCVCVLLPHLVWVDIRQQLLTRFMQAPKAQLVHHITWWSFPPILPIGNIKAEQQHTPHEVCHRALLFLGNPKGKVLSQH